MQGLPPELSSPPVQLVALVGRPDLHVAIGEFLRTQNTPRLQSIGIAEPAGLAAAIGEMGAIDEPRSSLIPAAALFQTPSVDAGTKKPPSRTDRPARGILKVRATALRATLPCRSVRRGRGGAHCTPPHPTLPRRRPTGCTST
jgi:hypothetical protein